MLVSMEYFKGKKTQLCSWTKATFLHVHEIQLFKMTNELFYTVIVIFHWKKIVRPSSCYFHTGGPWHSWIAPFLSVRLFTGIRVHPGESNSRTGVLFYEFFGAWFVCVLCSVQCWVYISTQQGMVTTSTVHWVQSHVSPTHGTLIGVSHMEHLCNEANYFWSKRNSKATIHF